MYSFIARHILAPVLDYSRGTRTLDCLKQLDNSQWWPRAKLHELQNQRLKQLVDHAYTNVPYYQHLFDERSIKPGDIQCTQDIVKLPVLTKNIARICSRELMAQNFPTREIVQSHTGGSTGEPLAFFTSRKDQVNWGFAAALRAFEWAGYELGDRMAVIAVVRPYSSTIARFRREAKDFIKRTLMLDAKKLSVRTIPLYARKLYSFQPKFLSGYPSALELLARFIQGEEKYQIRPKAVITGAEQLYDYQRELFSSVFQCETYRYYSSWEVHELGSECAAHTGYHVTAENAIVEIVDDEGFPVADGREGRIVITNLHNYAMPFIRYEIGDVGAISEDACPCGRGLPLLTKLSGRTSDIIVTTSGKSVPGSALIYVFREPMGVAQFQMVQENYNTVTVRIVMEKEYPEEHLVEISGKIVRKYRDVLGEDMDIRVKVVDHIPQTMDGKRRVIISKITGS
ncbi:phenylacetate--CoA ligase family protein [Chloroflexota bacterium]